MNSNTPEPETATPAIAVVEPRALRAVRRWQACDDSGWTADSADRSEELLDAMHTATVIDAGALIAERDALRAELGEMRSGHLLYHKCLGLKRERDHHRETLRGVAEDLLVQFEAPHPLIAERLKRREPWTGAKP